MNKYLIVVDMQNDFVNGALGSSDATAIVPNVVEKIKNWNGPVIVTRDTHHQNYMSTREGKYLPVPHCISGTEGWQVNADVQNALNDKDNVVYVDKPTFGSVGLPKAIAAMQKYKKEDYESVSDMEIELIGLCTDICVVSNAMLLKATFPEVNISVDQHCCAGVTPATHEAALTTMKSCQINII